MGINTAYDPNSISPVFTLSPLFLFSFEIQNPNQNPMISSKNWVSRPGVIRHYGISRAVEIMRVYNRSSRMRRLAGKREEAEVVRSPAAKRYRVEVAKRACEDCSTRRTPLWRKGPSGQRTLCNACGIRYRRRTRRLRANSGRTKCENSSSSSTTSTEEGLSYEELKQRQKEKQMKMLLLLDWTNKNNKDKVNKIQNNPIKMKATSTVEDEEAALLLLSLSSAILLP